MSGPVGNAARRVRIKGRKLSVIRFFSLSIGFTIVWVILLSQLAYYSKLYGPQVLLQMNIAYYLPSIPILLIAGQVEKVLDERIGTTMSMFVRLTFGILGCAVLSACFPFIPQHATNLLWVVVGLGSFSAISLSTSYQLVAWFRSADTIALGIGCVGGAPLALMIQVSLQLGTHPKLWQWIAMFEIAAGVAVLGMLCAWSIMAQYWKILTGEEEYPEGIPLLQTSAEETEEELRDEADAEALLFTSAWGPVSNPFPIISRQGSYGLTVPRLQHQIKSGIALRRAASAESDLAFADWNRGSSSAVVLGGAPRRARTAAGADLDYLPGAGPAAGVANGAPRRARTAAGADLDYLPGAGPAAGVVNAAELGAILRTQQQQQQGQQPIAHSTLEQEQPHEHAELTRPVTAAVWAGDAALDMPWLQSVQQQQAAQPVAVGSSVKDALLGDTSSVILSAPISTCKLSQAAESPEPLDGRGQVKVGDPVPEQGAAPGTETRQQQLEQWQLELLGVETSCHPQQQPQQQVGSYQASPFSQPEWNGSHQQEQQQHRLSSVVTAADAASHTSDAAVPAAGVAAESPRSRLMRRPPSAPGKPSAAAWLADHQDPSSLDSSCPSSVALSSPVKRRPASPLEQYSCRGSSVGSPSHAAVAAAACIGHSASGECLGEPGDAVAVGMEAVDSSGEQEGFLAVTWEVFKCTWTCVLAALICSTLLNCMFPFFTYVPSSGMFGEQLPQVMFYLRMLSDIMGRFLPRKKAFAIHNAAYLFIMALLLIAVSGLFFLYLTMPPQFQHDSVPIGLVMLMYLGGGYVNTTSYILAPGMVEPRRATKAAALMALVHQGSHIVGLALATGLALWLFGDISGDLG